MAVFKQGAEAKLYFKDFCGRKAIVKQRFSKKYRHQELDEHLCKERTRSEVRAMMRCSGVGIQTPTIYFVDASTSTIWMEYVEDSITVKEYIYQVILQDESTSEPLLKSLAMGIGMTLAKMHTNNIIHGDLTTSNMLLYPPYESFGIVLIDFGLSYVEAGAEDKGVDLYVLERAFVSTHPKLSWMIEEIIQSYAKECPSACDIMKKLDEVRLRGRKRTMVG